MTKDASERLRREREEKKTEQITFRLDEGLKRRLDEYIERHARLTGFPLNHSMALRCILEEALGEP